MEPKPWYLSRLAIVGIITAVVGAVGTVANIIAGHEVLDAGTIDTAVAFVTGVVIFILRWRTNQPIAP